MTLTEADIDLLLRLLRTPTAGPLETQDPPAELWHAQRDYAAAAAQTGLRVLRHAPATQEDANRPDVPRLVRTAAADPEFLACQPSLLLRLGPELPREQTVMFNVHLDTVAGSQQPVGFDGRRFTGRGAIDAKGPAVALLAGIRAAVHAEPSLGNEIGVLVQAVAGEEGGAMGTIGTRPLVDAGFFGRLNVFCEPTGMRYLPRATAAMTARIRVDGRDAIDDRPEAGHNASVLLGFLAQHLASTLDSAEPEGAVCLAGLHTGLLHNRVYGTGQLLLNLSYATTSAAARLEQLLEEALKFGLAEFSERFGGSREFGRTAEDATAITTLDWLKRGLPTLHVADTWGERLLTEDVGLRPWPAGEPAFTCDAIWLGGKPGTYTVVLGPGSLEGNNAHAEGEFAELSQLDSFATAVTDLLTGFARRARHR